MPFVTKPPRPSQDATLPDPCPEQQIVNPPTRQRTAAPDRSIDSQNAAFSDLGTNEAGQAGDVKKGRGHPPVEFQFKPGQSGNPKGRPKGAKGLKTLAKEVLSEKVNVRTARGVEKMSKMKALIHKQTELAFSGNVRALLACAAIWDKSVPEDSVKAPAAGEPSAVKAEELDVVDLATLQAFAAMLATREGDPL